MENVEKGEERRRQEKGIILIRFWCRRQFFMTEIRKQGRKKVYFVCNEKLKSFDLKDEIKNFCVFSGDEWKFFENK